MTTLGAGFRVGHWTDPQLRSGCTVILPPPGNVTSCDIRGSSPSSRELEHLYPDRKLTEVHAVVLTGGSAFGLATADGVVTWLEERGVGYETPIGKIPIVPAAVIFDAAAVLPGVRPDAHSGRAACEAAQEEVATGRVGAGAGATIGKWAGREHAVAGGLGVGIAESGGMQVHALAVVNAVGDVIGPDGSVVAGTTAPDPVYRGFRGDDSAAPTNTVLAALTLSAALDKRDLRFLAARGSDGMTVAVRPAHTRYDGDVCFAIAGPPPQGAPPANLDVLGHLATAAVADAIRSAVRP